MKKLSFYITILFRKTINEKVDADQLAYEVFKLIESKDDLRTMEFIKAFENICEQEMRKKEKRCAEVCRAINEKWVPEVVKTERNPYTYDPNYDKSLNELTVTFPM